jgi:hypothetical protein
LFRIWGFAYCLAVRLSPLLLAVAVAVAPGCSRAFEVESDISQGGGDLIVRGDFGSGRAVVVLVDGVAASAAVFESASCVRVRVPALPRSGTVDVELMFADGETIQLDGALRVSAPPLQIRE